MRIAILAPIWERVPPPAYGGIELVVSLLTEGLVEDGHDVTLFATGDSETGARLVHTEARSLRAQGFGWRHGMPHELVHVKACLDRASEFDVIHNHAGYVAAAFGHLVDTPVLTTLHGPFERHNHALFEACRAMPFVSISDAQRVGGPALHYLATVYNGIDTALFGLQPKQGYMVHLGRISPEKGTHIAAEAAHRTGRTLVIAGKVDPVDGPYYEEAVKPLIDGDRVRYIGEVGGQPKADLLARADVLLHPVQWPEPFGLVMAEAMAAGTPVIAFSEGSIPEVVDDGLTGFVVSDLDGLCAALDKLPSLEPAAIRRHAVARFDARRMTRDYLAIYEQLDARVTIAPQAQTELNR
ncbi:MAG TPA: glycosyltransferase family 4 protein [Oscillatoriaceae cyanobacterium]